MLYHLKKIQTIAFALALLFCSTASQAAMTKKLHEQYLATDKGYKVMYEMYISSAESRSEWTGGMFDDTHKKNYVEIITTTAKKYMAEGKTEPHAYALGYGEAAIVATARMAEESAKRNPYSGFFIIQDSQKRGYVSISQDEDTAGYLSITLWEVDNPAHVAFVGADFGRASKAFTTTGIYNGKSENGDKNPKVQINLSYKTSANGMIDTVILSTPQAFKKGDYMRMSGVKGFQKSTLVPDGTYKRSF